MRVFGMEGTFNVSVKLYFLAFFVLFLTRELVLRFTQPAQANPPAAAAADTPAPDEQPAAPQADAQTEEAAIPLEPVEPPPYQLTMDDKRQLAEARLESQNRATWSQEFINEEARRYFHERHLDYLIAEEVAREERYEQALEEYDEMIYRWENRRWLE